MLKNLLNTQKFCVTAGIILIGLVPVGRYLRMDLSLAGFLGLLLLLNYIGLYRKNKIKINSPNN